MAKSDLRIMRISDDDFIELKMLSVKLQMTLGNTVKMLMDYFKEKENMNVKN